MLYRLRDIIYSILGIRFCPRCGHEMHKTIEMGMKVYKCRNCKSLILR